MTGMSNTLEASARRAAQRLAEAGLGAPLAEAKLLLRAALGLSEGALFRAADQPIDAGGRQRFEQLILRRVRREPYAYLVGAREFWSLSFAVGPATLVPRPESETLVEAALDYARQLDPPLSALDLGTGSGCLLGALLSEVPRATGVALDRCPQALGVARHNFARLGLGSRVALLCADWAAPLFGRFDLILVNPPYVAEGERASLEPELAYEPPLALFAGADGLNAYRVLAPMIGRLLAARGRAFVELGRGQADSVAELFEAGGLAVEARRADLAGIDRCLVLAPRKSAEIR
jgi:release factor glutamine methyltransferase